jgi:alpha-1,3-fucosyltransferase
MELVCKTTYVFRSVKRVIVIPIIFFLFVVCYYEAVTRPSKLISSVQTSERLNAASSSTKKILIWNPYSRFELEVFGEGADTFNSHRCPINNCFITKNRSWAPLHEFDGIIFNMPPLSLYKFPVDEHRRPEQRYIFFSQEPPSYIGEEVKLFNHQFNWTMSYASHADIRYHYGEIIPLPSAPTTHSTRKAFIHSTRNGENFAAGKTKMVAWFVSHCFTQSRREKYVTIMRQYIPVDIYGGCYSLRCPMNESAFLSTEPCYDMLDSNYKFYLAFENSFCNDYVTEKFFDILQRRIIPIVMGGANYSAIAPPHSYIDALLYSPRELAEYLKLLASDDQLYNEYFWWKPHFQIVKRYPLLAANALCSLCEKLHLNKTKSVYHDLAAGWSQKTQCRSPRFKGVRIFWGIF